MKNMIEFDEKCKPCGGTGIYVGMGERDGAGIICHTCGGTGCHHVKIEYEDFEGRIKRKNIERVFQTNPGIVIGKGKQLRLEDFGGISYEAWLPGHRFLPGTEMRKFTCPAWWYQSADYNKKPDWKECSIMGIFSKCNYFKEKNKCWKRWDKEFEEM